MRSHRMLGPGWQLLALSIPLLVSACAHKDTGTDVSVPGAPGTMGGGSMAGGPMGMGGPMGRAPSPGAALHPHEIQLEGTVSRVNTRRKTFLMRVTSVTLPTGPPAPLSPARPKLIVLNSNTSIQGATFSSLRSGQQVTAIGKDLGRGKKLPARQVIVGGAGGGGMAGAPGSMSPMAAPGGPPPGPGGYPGAPGPGSGYPGSGYPGGPPPAGYPGAPASGYPASGYPASGYPAGASGAPPRPPGPSTATP